MYSVDVYLRIRRAVMVEGMSIREASRVFGLHRDTVSKMLAYAAFAEEMSEFLKTSELTETRAFVRSFVKEVLVQPGRAAVIYSLPMPEDSPIGEADTAELALNGRVIASGRSGGPDLTTGRTIFEMWLGDLVFTACVGIAGTPPLSWESKGLRRGRIASAEAPGFPVSRE